jgi:hypothetical protein
MAFDGAIHKTAKELAEMQQLIDRGLLPRNAIEEHLENEKKAVFGEDYKTDPKTGQPIEQGKGSKAQPTLQSVEAYRKYGVKDAAYEANLHQMERDLAAYTEAQQKARRGRQATVRR